MEDIPQFSDLHTPNACSAVYPLAIITGLQKSLDNSHFGMYAGSPFIES
jgi:hypothetical protein